VKCVRQMYHYCAFEAPKSGTPSMMDRNRRLLALLVVVCGLSTFFWPVIETSPTVMGRSQWSASSIVQELIAARLPHPAAQGVGYVPLDLVLTYVALLIALVAICFIPEPRLLATIAWIGGCVVCEPLVFDFDRWNLRRMFYGSDLPPSGLIEQVYFHKLTISTLVVMIFLSLIAP